MSKGKETLEAGDFVLINKSICLLFKENFNTKRLKNIRLHDSIRKDDGGRIGALIFTEGDKTALDSNVRYNFGPIDFTKFNIENLL